MGCEGGVVLYDADAIEDEFGPDVWAVTGFGREHCNPMVGVAGKRVLVGSFDTCKTYDYGDPLAECIHEAWRLDSPDDLDEWCSLRPAQIRASGDAEVALHRLTDHPDCRVLRLRVAKAAVVVANVETWT